MAGRSVGQCLQVLYRQVLRVGQCCVSVTPCTFVLNTVSEELAVLMGRIGKKGFFFANTPLEVFLLGVLCYVRKGMPCVAPPPLVSDVVSAAELFTNLFSKLEFRARRSAT